MNQLKYAIKLIDGKFFSGFKYLFLLTISSGYLSATEISHDKLQIFAMAMDGSVQKFEDRASGELKDRHNNAFAYEFSFLGKGGFGDVFKITFKTKDGQGSIAAKVIREAGNAEKPEDGSDPEEVKRAIRNLTTFQADRHFLRFFGSIKDKNGNLGILTELGGEDLNKLYVVKKEVPLPYSTLFKQIADGVKYMHDLGYGHFDLKPANMLLGKDNQVKIIDTDDAGDSLTKHTRPISGVSSLGYTAPEFYTGGQKAEKGWRWLFGRNAKIDWRALDIHALGMTFLSLLKGEKALVIMINVLPPLKQEFEKVVQNEMTVSEFQRKVFEAIADGQLPKAIENSQYNDKSPILTLIIRMLNPNPLKGNRPDIQEVRTELDKIYPE